MTESWATFGADFHLDLGSGRGRAALERALRDAVQSGRLHPGTRLPSSRALAADLGIARNTIVEAYGQLVAEGWLTAVTGSGTQVADRAVPMTPTPVAPSVAKPARYDLRPGHPDPSSFPRTEWLKSAKRAITAAPADAFGYGDPRGRPELREALAGYLARARGVRADAANILVCTGFTQALSLLSEVFVGHIAIETYGHRSYRDLLTHRGLRIRDVSVDPLGAVVDDFGDATAAVLTPAHQFPLGMALAAARRTEAIRWAARTGGWVIEDDYDGEFRYDRQAVGAMQALAPHRVIYAGTASKTLAPALRLGWLVLPAELVDDVMSAKAMADRHTGVLDQLTLADFITSGGYDRHIRRSRLVYRRRRDHLVAAIGDRAQISGLAAGMHAVLSLRADQSETDVVDRARARGLAIEGLSAFGPPVAPALVIGYGTPPAQAYTTAVARLVASLA